jgi:hypothetical protein
MSPKARQLTIAEHRFFLTLYGLLAVRMIAPSPTLTTDMRTLSQVRPRGRVAVPRILFPGLLFFVVSAPAGCSNWPTNRGGIDVIATLPPDVSAEVLVFELTGNGIAPMTGVQHVSKPQKQFQRLIGSVPVGEDYDLYVSAQSIDGRYICKRSTKVSVRANEVTRVHIPLSCDNANVIDNGGKVTVVVGFICPGSHLVDYMVSPLFAEVGDPITVTATTAKPDAGALAYDWTAPTGSFADPAAAQTTYRCDKPGYVTLNLFVANGVCTENHSIDVDCLGKDAGGD